MIAKTRIIWVILLGMSMNSCTIILALLSEDGTQRCDLLKNGNERVMSYTSSGSEYHEACTECEEEADERNRRSWFSSYSCDCYEVEETMCN